MSDVTGSGSDPSRRKALTAVIKVCGAVIGAVALLPVAGMFLQPALGSGPRKKRKVLFASMNEAMSTTFVAARYEGEDASAPGIFFRLDNGKPFVLSAKCTHAGCAVNWDAAHNGFLCPCHQGRYDSNGKNISGPPPSPLVQLEASMQGSELYILEPES